MLEPPVLFEWLSKALVFLRLSPRVGDYAWLSKHKLINVEGDEVGDQEIKGYEVFNLGLILHQFVFRLLLFLLWSFSFEI